MGLLTGCRLGELLGLRRANFFPSEHQLVVSASSSKRRQTRTIDLTLSPALERLLAAIPGDTTLFFPYQTSARARHIVNKAIRRGVPEFTPQTLRQTCATYTVAIRGASVESQQLGHQIAVAQRHYVGLVARIDRVATLEAAMGVEAEVEAITQALRKG